MFSLALSLLLARSTPRCGLLNLLANTSLQDSWVHFILSWTLLCFLVPVHPVCCSVLFTFEFVKELLFGLLYQRKFVIVVIISLSYIFYFTAIYLIFYTLYLVSVFLSFISSYLAVYTHGLSCIVASLLKSLGMLFISNRYLIMLFLTIWFLISDNLFSITVSLIFNGNLNNIFNCYNYCNFNY